MYGSSEVYRSRSDVLGRSARGPAQTFSDAVPGKGLMFLGSVCMYVQEVCVCVCVCVCVRVWACTCSSRGKKPNARRKLGRSADAYDTIQDWFLFAFSNVLCTFQHDCIWYDTKDEI